MYFSISQLAVLSTLFGAGVFASTADTSSSSSSSAQGSTKQGVFTTGFGPQTGCDIKIAWIHPQYGIAFVYQGRTISSKTFLQDLREGKVQRPTISWETKNRLRPVDANKPECPVQPSSDHRTFSYYYKKKLNTHGMPPPRGGAGGAGSSGDAAAR